VKNRKEGKNNCIRCTNCRKLSCFLCKLRVFGKLSEHFGARGCAQHS
jgi:hypothetical protein